MARTRTAAQKLVLAGRVRVNRDRSRSASRLVHPGDVLTVATDGGVRVLKVLEPGVRRGPAVEARTLYEDLSPPPPPRPAAASPAAPGRRPDKRQRRALMKLRQADGDDFSGPR